MYRYAIYYYIHLTLLLYNPALWMGEREFDFEIYWNTGHTTPADERAKRRHMYEHEVYAHCLRLCQDIARTYPRSPVAPKALYRGACAANFLSDFNYWWREEEASRTDYGRVSVKLMRRLARNYPADPLAAKARKYAAVFQQHLLAASALRIRISSSRAL